MKWVPDAADWTIVQSITDRGPGRVPCAPGQNIGVGVDAHDTDLQGGDGPVAGPLLAAGSALLAEVKYNEGKHPTDNATGPTAPATGVINARIARARRTDA
jgi:hypothetical protein